MDKNTFISQLRQALSVLQMDELEDIVYEYQQHIDMKMKSGLSQEEAIADFGSLEELTAEILGAYHVRADYAKDQKQDRKRPGTDPGTAGRELLQQTGQTCRNAGEKAARGIRGFGGWLRGVFRFWKEKLARTVSGVRQWWDRRRLPGEEADMREGSDQGPDIRGDSDRRLDIREPSVRLSRRRRSSGSGHPILAGVRGLFRMAAHMVSVSLGMGLGFAAWGIRMLWNACWMGVAGFCICFGLVCLYILGLLVILWMQHYPLAGVTVGCLGLVLCAFSAAIFSLTLLRWKKRRISNEEMEGEPCA